MRKCHERLFCFMFKVGRTISPKNQKSRRYVFATLTETEETNGSLPRRHRHGLELQRRVRGEGARRRVVGDSLSVHELHQERLQSPREKSTKKNEREHKVGGEDAVGRSDRQKRLRGAVLSNTNSEDHTNQQPPQQQQQTTTTTTMRCVVCTDSFVQRR